MSFILRSATDRDLSAIKELQESENLRPLIVEAPRYIRDYPSAVAEMNGDLAGFCYCCRFAPDILEIANILVSKKHRGTGLGSQLLSYVEDEAAKSWSGIILSNSDAYAVPGKLAATNFYLRNGYSLSYETDSTRVFVKSLRKS